jgi:dolichol-phosphate mannosyltransferase
MTEHSTFFRGMSAWIGYKKATIDFVVPPRASGKSTWSKIKLMRLAISAITAYSSLPLQIVTITGILFLAGSLLLAVQTLYKYFAGIAFTGFTTVILLLLIIGSTLMISLGIIGTYIARIYEEVKNRPRYIIAEETTKETNREDF